MQVEVLKGGWIKQGSVIAFSHEWQRPAKTEEWVYETLIEKQVHSMFVEFIAFPWATLIDLLSRDQWDRANQLILALKNLPSKKSLLRVTCCQHIKIQGIQEYLNEIKVTDLFWAHKSINDSKIGAIRLHPMALYPFAYFNLKINNLKPLSERKYKFSFVGTYDSQGYLSDIREKIFNLPVRADSYIRRRDFWHFEGDVYLSQIMQNDISDNDLIIQNKKEEEYISVMSQTIFSLCPTGAGLNTIRYWESLAFGCIPVTFTNLLDKPSVVNSFEISLPAVNLLEELDSLDKILQGEEVALDKLSIVDPRGWLSNIYDDMCNPERIFRLIGDNNEQ
jgi:hypothetical protein